MNTHSSASVRVETPHETETNSNHNQRCSQTSRAGSNNDFSIDPQWRCIIRYALEINDPLLPDLVRRADAGEKIIHTTEFSQTPESNEDDSNEEDRSTGGDNLSC